MNYLGIDPGITGALAFLRESGEVSFYDTPIATVKIGKKLKTIMDIKSTALLVDSFIPFGSIRVVLEKVNAMPSSKDGKSMGATSAFSFGMGFGVWQGIFAALNIPYILVHPATWKKCMLPDTGKEKDSSRLKAMQLFPELGKSLNLKKHHGRADALFIALYGKRFGGFE